MHFSSFTIRFATWVIALVAVTAGGGCAQHSTPQRPDIHELIADAIDHSAQQPQGEISSQVSYCENDTDDLPVVDHEIFTVSDEQDIELLPALNRDIQTSTSDANTPKKIVSEILLSEEFIETDVREVLFLLAEEAKVEVVLDEQVRGIVNISLEETTFDQALERILLPLNYVFAKRGEQYLIAPPDPKSPLFHLVAEQAEYHPRNLTTQALLDTTPKSMKVFVSEVKGANSILIYAPRQFRDFLLKQYSQLDQPVPQVVLEAIICVVSPDCGFRFGVNWGHAVELDGKSALDLGVSGLAIKTQFSPAGFDAMFQDFATTSFFIKKLAEHGYLTIRAAPRIMAKDGEQANISINRETFFTVQPSNANGDNNAFFFQQDIQKVESGITLDITPHIRGDVVTVEIEKAEISEDIRNANVESAVNPFPIINRRSVSTTVDVQDGRTIVIGGLVQRETVDRVNKVPGLSDAPIVGRLFKNNQSQVREVEVVIFISPKIVAPCQTGTASLILNQPKTHH